MARFAFWTVVIIITALALLGGWFITGYAVAVQAHQPEVFGARFNMSEKLLVQTLGKSLVKECMDGPEPTQRLCYSSLKLENVEVILRWDLRHDAVQTVIGIVDEDKFPDVFRIFCVRYGKPAIAREGESKMYRWDGKPYRIGMIDHYRGAISDDVYSLFFMTLETEHAAPVQRPATDPHAVEL